MDINISKCRPSYGGQNKTRNDPIYLSDFCLRTRYHKSLRMYRLEKTRNDPIFSSNWYYLSDRTCGFIVDHIFQKDYHTRLLGIDIIGTNDYQYITNHSFSHIMFLLAFLSRNVWPLRTAKQVSDKCNFLLSNQPIQS